MPSVSYSNRAGMSHSALVASEVGMLVRRFPSAAAARAAELDRETDGLPASLMARVCSWCSQGMGAVVCEPAQAGKVTHGICPACQERLLGELPGVPKTLVQGKRLESEGRNCCCGGAPADADLPAPSLSPASPGVNDASAARATVPQQVNGISAPGASVPPAMDHPSRDPGAASLYPAERFWCVQGSDFGRAIRWAKRQPRLIAEAVRAKLGGAS